MKKILTAIIFAFLVFFPSVVSATPSGVMTFGGMTKPFSESDFRQFWQKAYPEMIKIHGPAYSSFTFTVEARPDLAEHDGGWDPIKKQVLYDIQPLKSYEELLKTNPIAALNSIENVHEEAHAMYTYGDKVMKFPVAWIHEGWAKTTEDIIRLRIQNDPPRPGLYLSLLMDKDTVGGTESFGRAKQRKNMNVVYDPLTVASLNLLYGCSSSNSDPDFQSKMDQIIFDEYVVKNKLDQFNKLPLSELQKIIKNICGNKKIDGEDATTWYFSNPSALTKGNLGFHIGFTPRWWAYTTVEGLDIYTFNRVQNTKDQDLSEKGITASVKTDIFDRLGKVVYSKEAQTDQDGNVFLNFGRDFLKNGTYFVIVSSTYQGKNYQFKMPIINIRDQDGTGDDQKKAEGAKANGVIGIMVDKNLTPLDSKYLAVLQPVNGAKITANSNGLFLAEVSNTTIKEIAFDFLDQTFTFTKPPFRRVVVLKVSDDLIKKAQVQNEYINFVDKGFQNPADNKLQNQNESGNAQPLPNSSKAFNLQKLLIAFVGAVMIMGIAFGFYLLIIKKGVIKK
ncbi:MAG: hypothetical protein WC741_02235 [Patescibacteria group bacterium]